MNVATHSISIVQRDDSHFAPRSRMRYHSHGVEEPLEVLVGLVLVHQDVQLVDQLALNLEKK